MKPLDNVTTIAPHRAASRSLDRAISYIKSCVDSDGGMLSRIAFDHSFEVSHPLADARAVIRRQLGVDVGFDLSDDLSSAILGLSLLPPEEDNLVRSFARLVGQGRSGRRFRLFVDPRGFPADTDCTAVASQALHDTAMISSTELVLFANELLAAAAPQEAPAAAVLPYPGVVTVYWEDGDLSRGRKYDPVVCANVLCVLKEAERNGMANAAGVIDATQRYVVEHLLSGAYLEGTRYYPYAEAFLHAASRLAERFPDCRELLAEPLAAALRGLEAGLGEDEGNGRTWTLNVALRTLTAHNIGLSEGQGERRKLLAGQQELDGSWPASPYYTLGRFPVYFGSRLLSTLFAASALRLSEPHQEPESEESR